MIKKILTMSAGIVLGSMMTTASFADHGHGNDCHDARYVHGCLLGEVQWCRDNIPPCTREELAYLRDCKRTCMRVARAVCEDGTYMEPAHPYDEAPNYDEYWADLKFCDMCARDYQCTVEYPK